ncbi:MAG: hypothetical protein AB7D57_03020 [Desulfovibrionaceae bacterium]
MSASFDNVCRAAELVQKARDLYAEAVKTCVDGLGAEVFALLRDQAEGQLERLAEVSRAMSRNADWAGACALSGEDAPDLRGAFRGMAQGHAPEGACLTELGAARAALAVNDDLVAFFEAWTAGADLIHEATFARRLAEEQRGQRLMLADLVDYYEDPEDWALRQDNAILDGA